MNHMAITWWARDTMYWLNLIGMEETNRSECDCAFESMHVLCVCEHLLGRVSIG